MKTLGGLAVAVALWLAFWMPCRPVTVLYTGNLQGSILAVRPHVFPEIAIGRRMTAGQVYHVLRGAREEAARRGRAVLLIDGGDSLWGPDPVSGASGGELVAALWRDVGMDAVALGPRDRAHAAAVSAAERALGLPLCATDLDGKPRFLEADGLRIALVAVGSPPASSAPSALPSPPPDAASGAGSRPSSAPAPSDSAPGAGSRPPSDAAPGAGSHPPPADPAAEARRLAALVREARASADVCVVLAACDDVACVRGCGADVVVPTRPMWGASADRPVTLDDGTLIAPAIDGRVGLGHLVFERRGWWGRRVVLRTDSVPLLARYEVPPRDLPPPIAARVEALTAGWPLAPRTLLDDCVGYALQPMPHDLIHFRETPLGDWVTDNMCRAVGAEVALLNHLALRAGLDGPIGVEQMTRAVPFGSKLVTVELSGAELKSLLAPNAREDRRFLQCAGLRLQYLVGDPSSTEITRDGQPLDAARRYRVVVLDYMCGEERYPLLAEAQRQGRTRRSGVALQYVVYEPLLERRIVTPPPPRMTRLADEEPGDAPPASPGAPRPPVSPAPGPVASPAPGPSSPSASRAPSAVPPSAVRIAPDLTPLFPPPPTPWDPAAAVRALRAQTTVDAPCRDFWLGYAAALAADAPTASTAWRACAADPRAHDVAEALLAALRAR